MSGRCARWSYGRQPTETLPKCFSHGALYQPNPVTAVKTVATRKRAVQLFILCAPIMRYKTPLQSRSGLSRHTVRSSCTLIFKDQGVRPHGLVGKSRQGPLHLARKLASPRTETPIPKTRTRKRQVFHGINVRKGTIIGHEHGLSAFY